MHAQQAGRGFLSTLAKVRKVWRSASSQPYLAPLKGKMSAAQSKPKTLLSQMASSSAASVAK